MRKSCPARSTIVRLATIVLSTIYIVASPLYAQNALYAQNVMHESATASDFQWWQSLVVDSVTPHSNFVIFDLNTVLIDTLVHSPRIQSVSSRTSMAFEKIVQQDAAFDSRLLLETSAGRVNDPVGNTLITGGPERSIQETYSATAGVGRTTRGGTAIDLSQEIGTLDSNSLFFDPDNQGNSRLSLSLTRPLLAGGGQVYTERLLTQARIDANVSWQEMRRDIEKRISEVMVGYWQLYELRCHLLQQQKLLERAKEIEQIVQGRDQFDSGRIELAKVRGRVARRVDQVIAVDASVRRQQTRLAMLIGNEALINSESHTEMIPSDLPLAAAFPWTLRDAVTQGIQHRAEIRAAAQSLESAALTLEVTRNQLLPNLNAVVNGYLAGLNGNYGVFNSFGDQFSRGGPGLSAELQYERPSGNRYALARRREANHFYRQKSEELREAIQVTRAEIEIAMVDVQTALSQQQSKREMVFAAIEEESILRERWLMMGGDGGRAGLVLENLLDAQQRRTDAEREWVSTQVQYLSALIHLQRSMGTLLVHEQIETQRQSGSNSIHITRLPAYESRHDDRVTNDTPDWTPNTEPNDTPNNVPSQAVIETLPAESIRQLPMPSETLATPGLIETVAEPMEPSFELVPDSRDRDQRLLPSDVRETRPGNDSQAVEVPR